MSRFRCGFAALGIFALAGAVMAAQAPAGQAPAGGGQRAAGPPPPPPTNLQIMPKDTPRNVVVQRMQAMTAALGVTCAYCHVFEGPNNPANDFAVDTKAPKLVARVMMTLTGEINQKLAATIKKPADQLTPVGCMTCHRGAAIPVLPPPAPAPQRGAAPAGAPAAPVAPAPPAPAAPAPGQ